MHSSRVSTPGSAQTVSVTHDTLVRAVERALRAPSVHNTQPWRWRIGDGVIDLFADRSRHLSSTDPDGRDLAISCGAALHHLRVALAQERVSCATERMPDPENSALLASVHVSVGAPDEQDAALSAAMADRRTDRRAMAAAPSPAQMRRLVRQAARQGAVLHPVEGHAAQVRLLAILDEAGFRQRHVPGYPAELAIWTRRYAGGRDGIPPEQRTTQPTAHTLRNFPAGRLAGAPLPRTAFEDGSTVAVLATDHDEVVDWLRAGEATSAVLLAAERLGLATTPLSQAVEVEHTRRQLARAALGTTAYPQLLIRIGHRPENAKELPSTPRRTLRSVLLTGRGGDR
jgi:nitroreductase